MEKKLEALKAYLKELGSVAVAFSGGVDSALLLKTAHEVLGQDAAAVTAYSCSFPERELNESMAFCEREGIRQYIMRSDEMEDDEYRKNPKNRCFICKSHLFTGIRKVAEEHGLRYIAEGSNLDDVGDYRPGLQAAKELGVKSPLLETGLTKQEIRALAKEMGLPVWNKPSFACLASRFPYGEEITAAKLGMVEEAEQLLLDLGFPQMRVRIHGKTARIEILPEDFPKLMQEDNRQTIVTTLKDLGFTYITLDLQGFRSGSMNEALK